MDRTYYYPEVDISGKTADELYVQVRNNYISDISALERIRDILDGEGKRFQSALVSAEIEYQTADEEDELSRCLAVCKRDVASSLVEGGKPYLGGDTFRDEGRDIELWLDAIPVFGENTYIVQMQGFDHGNHTSVSIPAGKMEEFCEKPVEELVKLWNAAWFYAA